MHLILYTSKSAIASSVIDEEMFKISQQAKRNNQKHNITGVLFFHNGLFIQVLEGEKQPLEQLMTRIEADNRHQQINRIIDENISQRFFKDWQMDAINLNNSKDISPATLEMFVNVYKLNYTLKTDQLVVMIKTLLENKEDFLQ